MKKIFPDIIPALRFIHQVIVVVSVALLLSVFSTNKGIDTNSAIDDLRKIKTYVENWDELIIESAYISSKVNIYDEELYLYNYWKVEIDSEEIDWKGNVQSSSHIVSFSAPSTVFFDWTYVPGGIYARPVILVDAPKSLREFSGFWDKIREIKSVNVYYRDILDHAYVQRRLGDPVEKVSLTVLNQEYSEDINWDGQSGIITKSIFDESNLEENDKKLYGLTYVSGNSDEFFAKIWIPVSTDVTDVKSFNAGRFLCYKIGIDAAKRDCGAGFEQVFPDLYYLSKDIQGLSFENLLDELEKQKGAEFQKFISFFGLEFSSIGLYQGGTALIVLSQLYFHLLLRTLFRIIENLDEFPLWIGLFPDRLSRFITITSSLLVPSFLTMGLTLSSLINFFPLGNWQVLIGQISFLVLIILASGFTFVVLYDDLFTLWEKLDKKNMFTKVVHHRRPNIRRKNRN